MAPSFLCVPRPKSQTWHGTLCSSDGTFSASSASSTPHWKAHTEWTTSHYAAAPLLAQATVVPGLEGCLASQLASQLPRSPLRSVPCTAATGIFRMQSVSCPPPAQISPMLLSHSEENPNSALAFKTLRDLTMADFSTFYFLWHSPRPAHSVFLLLFEHKTIPTLGLCLSWFSAPGVPFPMFSSPLSHLSARIVTSSLPPLLEMLAPPYLPHLHNLLCFSS